MRIALVFLLLAACGSPEPRPRMVPFEEPETAPGEEAPDRAATMPLTLRAKFEWAASDTLHAASPAVLVDEGPFAGNDLGPEDYELLDEQLLAMAGYEGLFACFEVGDGLFVLRGPGAGAPTDLFLAQWEAGPKLLTWVTDLAFDHCGEDGCARLQSWLVDLDGDGRRDVVRRSTREDAETGAVEDVLEAWLLAGDGTLGATTLPAGMRARFRAD
jgi:hypothetical protein